MFNNNYYSTKVLINQQQLQKPQQSSTFPSKENPQPYPLQIASISHKHRLKADWCCKLIQYESNLNLSGQFTIKEARNILEKTRYWDFSLDKNQTPRCADKLRSLIESIAAGGNR